MASEPQVQSAALVQETQFTASADQNIVQAENASSYGTSQPISSQPPSSSGKKAPRALGPDLLRGLIIVLQALDHAAVSAGAWSHGVALEMEGDGVPVEKWNFPVAWTARMLTHLCAPGFMFLMGMGIVYLGRSRTKLGWSHWRLVKHFFVRALVLALINEFLGITLTAGKYLLLNIVLLALAVNYFLAGLLWLALNESEKALTNFLASFPALQDDITETQPLLATETAPIDRKRSSRADSISFHFHNALLLALTVVTIAWNVWFSKDGGHCETGIKSDMLVARMPPLSEHVSLFDFMFYSVFGTIVISGFPPLAWISFVILGLLYARLILRQQRPAPVVAGATALVGVGFAILFVLTRLLHFGNLSEGCLRMPENLAHPEKNQYLVSFRAFFYTIKYPPSPAYMFYTMTLNMLLLAGFSLLPVLPVVKGVDNNVEGWSTKFLRVFYAVLLPFGQCALFFYTIHQMIYSAFGAIAKNFFGRPMGYTDFLTGKEAIGIGPGLVFWVDYLLGLVILWFACKWYSKFKGSKGPDSLWRFF